MTDNLSPGSPVSDALKAAVGVDKISNDGGARALLSQDLSPSEPEALAGTIVSVESAEDIPKVLSVAQLHKVPVVVRAGGMSYTGGYQPVQPNTVLIDLSGLNRVVAISEEDRFMIVEAGCTWHSVMDSLSGTGLRPVLRGPISGVISTVGGAASQNLPGSMDGILGVEVITANGDIIRTGSLGAHQGNGFYRNYGPDLTGFFLGDNGTHGVKTKVVLRLENAPAGVAHASFAFDEMQDVAGAMKQIAQQGLAARMFGLDPLKNKTATKVDTREGVDTLAKIATTSSKGLVGGIADAAKVALAGKKAFDDVAWSLHVTTEGVDQTAADSYMSRVNKICLEKGLSIEPSLPIAMAAKPFSIRGFLGIKGERWVPMHGIFPFSKVEAAILATEQFFTEHAEALSAHRIVHSFMLSAGDGYYLIEPMFYWPDTLLPVHEDALGADKIRKFGTPAPNLEARELVIKLRHDLRDQYFDLGALSAQIGGFYRFGDSIAPTSKSLLAQFRETIDPAEIINGQNQKL